MMLRPTDAVVLKALERAALHAEQEPQRAGGQDRRRGPVVLHADQRRRCGSRSTHATAATATVASSSRRSQRADAAPPDWLRPSAAAALTSRATVACSAEPGTTRIVKAASSAPSEP